ncbi:hypothetical protein R5R35_000468 [Gryllus longicercus]|uniref:Uncharacterized protein n=1 Tax=Gryllus longicercus TaxID=2509291 RepID=A0AAN9VIH4_9ORTH
MGSEAGETVVELTEEQQEFLRQCEEEFANRFTDQDEEFQKIKELPESIPPIVDPWYSRPPRADWNRNSNRGRRSYHDRDRDRDRNRDRDRDRDRDWQNHRGGSGPMYGHRYRDRRDRPY